MTLLLWIEISAVLAASAAMGVGAYRIARRRPIAIGIAVCAAAWLVFDVLFLRHTAFLARVIPWGDVIVLGNFSPLAIALLVAMLFRLRSGNVVFSVILAVALGVAGTWQSYRWAFDRMPSTSDRWRGDVCLQTTGATCSPAAAASLLRMYGIDTTEAEMAELCLTTIDGTTHLGLYRGLCLKTRGTSWKVEIFGGDVEQVYQAGPAIISVGIGRWQSVDPRYLDDWSWARGVPHTVVIRSVFPDRLFIADPGVGQEQWTRENMAVLWKGPGFRLVQR